jgi:hypothetical protein
VGLSNQFQWLFKKVTITAIRSLIHTFFKKMFAVFFGTVSIPFTQSSQKSMAWLWNSKCSLATLIGAAVGPVAGAPEGNTLVSILGDEIGKCA